MMVVLSIARFKDATKHAIVLDGDFLELMASAQQHVVIIFKLEHRNVMMETYLTLMDVQQFVNYSHAM
jgi:hypothetical protein